MLSSGLALRANANKPSICLVAAFRHLTRCIVVCAQVLRRSFQTDTEMKLKTTILSASLLAFVALAPASIAVSEEQATVTVFKTPWCGCCHLWAEAVEAAGYHVITHDLEDLSAIKTQAGIPDDLQSCHTAVLDTGRKYILEGHVPLEAMDKIQSERPDIRGLAVGGMPQGSLGMGNDPDARYDVHALPVRMSESPFVFFKAGEEK